MKKSLFHLVILISLTLITSCASYYSPSAYYIPVHTKRGDFSANIGVSHQQVGYAVTNNIGIFATQNKRNRSIGGGEESHNDFRSVSGTWKSVGLVPYFNIYKKTYFEIPISYGWGNREGNSHKYHEVDYYASFKSSSTYLTIQPTISFKFYEKHDISFFGRIYRSNTQVLESYLYKGTAIIDPLDEFLDNNKQFNDLSAELGTQFRFGSKNFKLYMQLAVMPYSKSGNLQLSPQVITFRSGLNFSFNTHNTVKYIVNYIKNPKEYIPAEKYKATEIKGAEFIKTE